MNLQIDSLDLFTFHLIYQFVLLRLLFELKKVNNLKTIGVGGELFKRWMETKVKLLGKEQLSYANFVERRQ